MSNKITEIDGLLSIETFRRRGRGGKNIKKILRNSRGKERGFIVKPNSHEMALGEKGW